jgi:hypothetical protein
VFIEIPIEWISNPPNKATLQVWFAISSTTVILSVSDLSKSTGLCVRVICRSLKNLSKTSLGISYFPGKGNVQSFYEVKPLSVLSNTHLRLKQYAQKPNDYSALSSGAYHTVRSDADLSNPSRVRSNTNYNNSSLNNLTKDNINSIKTINNKGKKKSLVVPYKEILNLFDQIVISKFPIIGYVEINRQAPKKYGGSSKKSLADSELGLAISDQWKKVKNLEWFKDYFQRAVTDCLEISAWHRGEVDDFRISLWWLLKRKKAQDKIFNKKYWEDKDRFQVNKKQHQAPEFFPEESRIIDIEVRNEKNGNDECFKSSSSNFNR